MAITLDDIKENPEIKHILDYIEETIPHHSREGIKNYVFNGYPVGGFLTEVFSNSLTGAFGHADHINRNMMYNYALFLYNAAPHGCWGSSDKVKEWQKLGGLIGIENKRREEATKDT